MQHKTLSLFSCIVLSLLLSVSGVKHVIYAQCSQLYFNSNESAYASNLNSLFTSLVESASVGNFNSFNISPPGCLPTDAVYGLFQCRGDLGNPDCRECVANSVSQLKTTCPVSIGGSIQSEGCLVRYNNTSTFGCEEKTEVFKSCGPSIGYNSDVIDHIDDALASLIGDGNGQYFRTGGSGSVKSVAQCEGDLSLSECENCIVEARARLRSECETSGWGDMYLGKCYIQYADPGIDDSHNKNNNNDNHGDTDTNYIPLLLAVILAVVLSSAGLSYHFFTTKKRQKKDENKFHEVRKTAQGAKVEANEAKKAAQGAKEEANGAKMAAEGAKEEAKGAKKAAEGAHEEAKGAKKAAEGAHEEAKGAKKAAEEAKGIGMELERRWDEVRHFHHLQPVTCINSNCDGRCDSYPFSYSFLAHLWPIPNSSTVHHRSNNLGPFMLTSE